MEYDENVQAMVSAAPGDVDETPKRERATETRDRLYRAASGVVDAWDDMAGPDLMPAAIRALRHALNEHEAETSARGGAT